MAKFNGFSLGLLHFLNELTANNNRDWFQKNKDRYENEVREPALDFIVAMQKPLKKISPHFAAVPKKVGGSLMRIHKDVRFSNDKSPYKTNVGIHFRHEEGCNVHTPGFYLHIEPDSVFVGAGIWHPESDSLNRIRRAIDEDSVAWNRAKTAKSFRESYKLSGDSLTRPPRGFSAEHAMIEDIKRKDFIGVQDLEADELFDSTLVNNIAAKFRAAKPLVKFLCDAVGVAF